MWGILLEEILLVITINHTWESAIVYSRRCPRVFIQIGLKFPSDGEDFHVNFFCRVLLEARGRGAKGGKNEIVNHLWPSSGMCLILHAYFTDCRVQSFLLYHPGTLRSQFKMQTVSVRTEWVIFHFYYFQLSFQNPFYAGNCPFLVLSIHLFFLSSLIVLVVWMVHVHFISFPLHLVLGAPPPILAISGNILLLFIDSPGFNIGKSFNITLVGVTSFSVGSGMGSVNSSYLHCCKDRIFI